MKNKPLRFMFLSACICVHLLLVQRWPARVNLIGQAQEGRWRSGGRSSGVAHDSESREALPPNAEPIAYQRVQFGLSEWAVVRAFTSIGDWHAAKAILERNGVLSRMGSGPGDDGTTDLLVPATEVFWAAELICRADLPPAETPRALGFPLVSPPTQMEKDLPSVRSEPGVSGALQVLDYVEPLEPETDDAGYGCALAVLWTLLGVVLALVIGCLATY